jgi:hypothetical protein
VDDELEDFDVGGHGSSDVVADRDLVRGVQDAVQAASPVAAVRGGERHHRRRRVRNSTCTFCQGLPPMMLLWLRGWSR